MAYVNRHSNLSPRTCNVYHRTLQEIFDTLFDDASLVTNPFKAIPKLENNSESREAFTADELRLIGENADPFLYAIFAIGINTGLREGDICTLRWDEIDLDSGWITRRMRKTGHSVRIPILQALHGFLLDLQSTRTSNEYVLPEQAETYLSNPAGISYRVRKFLESLKISTTRKVEERTREVSVKDVHSLRHTFCYLAALQGVPANIVQSIVGHMDPKITEMYMNHATDEAKREKLQSLPNYLGIPSGVPPISPQVSADFGRSKDRLLDITERLTADNWEEIKYELQRFAERL